MKVFSLVMLSSIALIVGCSKDKNLEDFQREQLQENISRINAISGSYSGPVVSKLDGTNLGSLKLKFQARTDISNTNQQSSSVSGSLSFKSLSSAEVAFDNGYYDDVSGDFQVTIPIAQDGGTTSKLYLSGYISGDRFNGSIEVKGQPEFGAELNLLKNAPASNTSAIEVGGTRLQQINRTNFTYVGSYKVNGEVTPFKLSFINRDILPEQNLFRIFSPVRNVSINCDFTDFELNFSNAVLDDKTGTIVGHDPFDQRGNPARATLSCYRFEDGQEFGWDCDIQTKVTLLRLHLKPKL